MLDFTAPMARRGRLPGALHDAGLAHDPSLEVDGEFTMAGGIAAGRQLLGRPDRPTAIFAASDEMAIGVLRAARELSLRVPEDVSVVGIDDHELAAFFDLTTVSQPVLEQGRVAARQVLDALAGHGHRSRLAPGAGDPARPPSWSAAAPRHRPRPEPVERPDYRCLRSTLTPPQMAKPLIRTTGELSSRVASTRPDGPE